ncbi:MAG TPA: nucleotidyltransferase [Chthoniobacterales bacterium]|nr:nucleotidyltransferase [Chthoniobacterales bacterium]
MTPDQYVSSIIAKYAQFVRPQAVVNAATAVAGLVTTWANQYLLQITYSGSSAKGTAIRGLADVDLFVSLAPNTPGTLSDIYTSLLNYRGLNPYSPKRQNVSVGVTYGGIKIDIVPARKQAGNTTDHSLFRSKAQTWTQTNVSQHINLVQTCGRLDEMRAVKIWRALHGLDFPSFYLELTILDALSGRRSGQLANNVWAVFSYLSSNFPTAVVIDPANSNNRISDDLTRAEKNSIAVQAAQSLAAPIWEQILW